ncbi:MAG: SdpI family protein [Pseudomonadota bacterium]
MTDQPFFIPAMLFVVLGLPLLLGLVPRNRIYGFRSRQAMADDRAWYRINRVGGLLACGAGAFYLGYAKLHPAPPGSVVGFDLTSGHTYAIMVPVVVAFGGLTLLRRWL